MVLCCQVPARSTSSLLRTSSSRPAAPDSQLDKLLAKYLARPSAAAPEGQEPRQSYTGQATFLVPAAGQAPPQPQPLQTCAPLQDAAAPAAAAAAPGQDSGDAPAVRSSPAATQPAAHPAQDSPCS
jgi:hypothetical protein